MPMSKPFRGIPSLGLYSQTAKKEELPAFKLKYAAKRELLLANVLNQTKERKAAAGERQLANEQNQSAVILIFIATSVQTSE